MQIVKKVMGNDYSLLWGQFWNSVEFQRMEFQTHLRMWGKRLKNKRRHNFLHNCIIVKISAVVHHVGQKAKQQEQCAFLVWFYSQMCNIPIRNVWVSKNTLGSWFGNSCCGASLDVQGMELQLLESWEQKGVAGLQLWKQFPREQRWTCKVCGNSGCYQVMLKKCQRNICSVRGKGLEELVVRL